MFEWVSSMFQGALAELVFLAICVVGMIFSGFSIFFGGDHDGADHGDMDGHDADHGGDHHADDGPKLFSVRGLMLFGTGFGAVGYLVQHFTGKTLVASVSGSVAGLVLAMIGIGFIRMIYRQQSSSLVGGEAYVGVLGTVVTAITSGGTGEVAITVAGTYGTRLAKSASGQAIARGESVRVTRTVGGVVVVEPV